MKTRYRLVKKNYNYSKYRCYYAIDVKHWWFPIWIESIWYHDLDKAQNAFRNIDAPTAGGAVHEILEIK